MKKILVIVTILVIALFIAGCAQQAKPTQTPPTTGGQEPTGQPAGKCIPKTCPSGQVQTDLNCECHVEPSAEPTDSADAPAKPSFDFGQGESNDLGSLGGQ